MPTPRLVLVLEVAEHLIGKLTMNYRTTGMMLGIHGPGIPDSLCLISNGLLLPLHVEPTKGTLYLDDGLEMSAPRNYVNHDIEEFDGATLIGRDTWLVDRYFKGAMDDVHVYNRVLCRPGGDTEFNRFERHASSGS